MIRDKKLAFRILKAHYECSWESGIEYKDQLWEHREFSDLDEDGKNVFKYYFHMLGYLGCFLDYKHNVDKEPILGLLSWFGHDFLHQLAKELGESFD